MEVQVRIGPTYSGDQDVERLFRLYRGRAQKTTRQLAQIFKFRPLSRLLMRPLRPDSQCYGMLIYKPGEGYTIAMHLELCRRLKDRGLEIVDHECSHIAAVRLHGYWGHGRIFQGIYQVARMP